MPDTSEESATKVRQIQVQTPPLKYARYSQVKTTPLKYARYSQVKTPPPKYDRYKWRHRHQSVILTNKSPLPKCSRYSQVKTLPPFSVICASHCLLEHLPISAAEDSRLQQLSSKHVFIFLSHWSKDANCWCHEFWPTTSIQSHFQCNILIIKMYKESKITWTVEETVRFYFRLCSMIYLFPTG
jgi:hypothetical protein